MKQRVQKKRNHIVQLMLENHQKYKRWQLRSNSQMKEGVSTVRDIELDMPMSVTSQSSVSATNSSNSNALRLGNHIQIN